MRESWASCVGVKRVGLDFVAIMWCVVWRGVVSGVAWCVL